MKRKQFLYRFSIVLGIFLIFFSGGNSSRADAASASGADAASAYNYGLTKVKGPKKIPRFIHYQMPSIRQFPLG